MSLFVADGAQKGQAFSQSLEAYDRVDKSKRWIRPTKISTNLSTSATSVFRLDPMSSGFEPLGFRTSHQFG